MTRSSYYEEKIPNEVPAMDGDTRWVVTDLACLPTCLHGLLALNKVNRRYPDPASNSVEEVMRRAFSTPTRSATLVKSCCT
jgi:hypothetical protein